MKLFEKITENLADKSIIAFEDKDLYTYGFQQGFLLLLNIITTIVIGLIFNMLWQCIVFSLAYIPLRSYAGGYHAKTQLRCYFFSVAMMIIVILIIKYIPWFDLSVIILTLISSGVILSLAPVEDINKPLSPKEMQVYKKISRLILLFEVFLVCIFIDLGISEVSICIMMALTTLGVMLVLGE